MQNGQIDRKTTTKIAEDISKTRNESKLPNSPVDGNTRSIGLGDHANGPTKRTGMQSVEDDPKTAKNVSRKVRKHQRETRNVKFTLQARNQNVQASRRTEMHVIAIGKDWARNWHEKLT